MRKPSTPKKENSAPSDAALASEKVSEGRITVTMPPALRKRLDVYLAKSRKEKAEFTRGLIESFLDDYEGKKEKAPKPGRDPERIAKALQAREEKLRETLQERWLNTVRNIGEGFRIDVRSENDRMISNLSRAVRNELREALIVHASSSRPEPFHLPITLANREMVTGFLQAFQEARFEEARAQLNGLMVLVGEAEVEYRQMVGNGRPTQP